MSFNEFAKQNGASILHMDELLTLQKTTGEEVVFFGSVYESPFTEMPENALTSENEYRKWCWKTTGIMPKKRTAAQFDDYVRPKMIEAVGREPLTGLEDGAVIADMILPVLSNKLRNGARDLDDPDQPKELDSHEWVFLETRPESKCGKEFYLKITGLAEHLSEQSRHGWTEVRFERKPVCKWLAKHGRQYGAKSSPNRVRSAYALPIPLIEDYRKS